MTSRLVARGVCKQFGARTILRDVDLAVQTGECLGILGDNGSGKSTLIRMLAGVLTPDAGSVVASIHGSDIPYDELPRHVGLVAPYLRLYDEFTPAELMRLHARWHGSDVSSADIRSVLGRVELSSRCDDPIRTFSSGLQQRMAIALAVQLLPDILILDEPSITLDRRGRDVLEAEIMRARDRGAMVILATNDDRERQLCTAFYNVSH